MKKRTCVDLRFIGISILLSLGSLAFAQSNEPILREDRNITIDGLEERWRLEWVNPPSPACGPEGDDYLTCPCRGFAFGEWGDLQLVRRRPGRKDEHFSLNTLFEHGDDLPKPYDAPGSVLRRWEAKDEDLKANDSPGFADRVRMRPLSLVMNFADYDHDGRATEFVLQIGTLPCGKGTSVVVGISRKNDRLHAFNSANRPKEPLILKTWQWDALSKSKGSVKVSDWLCGDHGYDAYDEVELRADKGSIYATRKTYECVDKTNGNGTRGRLIKKQDF